MLVFLILFGVSLVGVVWMLSRKLALVKSGGYEPAEEVHDHPFVPDIEKIKHFTKRGAKRYGYLALVTTLRVYVKTTNELKNRYMEIRQKMRNLKNKSVTEAQTMEQEASRFLKMISEYKHKIREIKHQIHEEERTK